MKGLADTERSLTLQPLTATGIHNLPAMNPFTYQEGVSLSKEQGYRGQHTGGRERSSMTQRGGDFRASSKHISALPAWTVTYISNFSSRVWRVHIKHKLFEVFKCRASTRQIAKALLEKRPSFEFSLKTTASSSSPCVFIVKAIKILSSHIIAPVRYFQRHCVTIYLLNLACMQGNSGNQFAPSLFRNGPLHSWTKEKKLMLELHVCTMISRNSKRKLRDFLSWKEKLD